MEGLSIHRSYDLHEGAMPGWMTPMVQLWNLWAIRIIVLFSFALHVVLILFAGICRRKAFGARTILLWLAYQGASWAATSALGHLTLGRTWREQQLVTFWAPFLLLHLGGPDNISAYSLEDNVLSGRQMFDVIAQLFGITQLFGATYGLYMHIYTHIIIGSDRALFWASVIMLPFGVGKYVEKSIALWKSDLGSIRSSSKKPSRRFTEPVGFRRGQQLGSERALLVAHSMFHICKGAFADYPLEELLNKDDISEEIFSYGWMGMCKVVEMELSLMYDILYTKAARVHTRFGYSIRVASPLASAAALWLFCLYNKYCLPPGFDVHGTARGDVVITYILLVATFLLDLMWLLTALWSTWTYAFLIDRPRSWLHHQLLCTGRWHRFRRFIVSLDPCRLLAKEPPSYRLWSGSIGQYNLLHECTHATTSQWRALAKKFSSEDRWMEYRYHYSSGLDISGSCYSNRNVRELLFEQIWKVLKSVYPLPRVEERMKEDAPKKDAPKKDAPKKEEKKEVAKEELVRRHRGLEEALNFDKDFQEDILIWQITTDVFLLCSDQNAASPSSKKYVKAIKALSDYMVFLVAVRPNMVPGLKLRSTYGAIRGVLAKIWREEGSKISPSCTRREKELASILRNMENKPGSKQRKPRKPGYASKMRSLPAVPGSLLYDKSIILSEGTKLAEELLKILSEGTKLADSGERKLSEDLEHFICDEDIEQLRGKIDRQKLLELIFKVWVRMLIFVSVRCSRDSHAKQLSRGGELTTIVWILVEHATYFAATKPTQ